MLNLMLPLSLATSALFGSVSTTAQKPETHLDVQPGLWQWSHQTRLSGIGFSEENTECLSQDMASMSLQEFVSKLDPACSVTTNEGAGGTIAFSLSCNGDIKGNATGTLTRSSDQKLSVQANGAVIFDDDVSAPFQFNAQASRQGSCG